MLFIVKSIEVFIYSNITGIFAMLDFNFIYILFLYRELVLEIIINKTMKYFLSLIFSFFVVVVISLYLNIFQSSFWCCYSFRLYFITTHLDLPFLFCIGIRNTIGFSPRVLFRWYICIYRQVKAVYFKLFSEDFPCVKRVSGSQCGAFSVSM